MAYKELVLPQKLNVDEKTITDTYAKFVAEPYERGYGHTVGNALRRVLLSSLDGAAVTAARIDKAQHEYMTLPGVKEDVMDILLNLKKLRLKLFSDGPETIYLTAQKDGAVKASSITVNSNVEVVNQDLVIAHLEAGGKLEMEIEVSRGRGYMTADELRAENRWPAGFLPLDALFSPVAKVHYDVENARVGQVTDYDRLILEIWTDGSISPMEALIQSSHLIRESLQIFIPQEEAQDGAPAEADGVAAGVAVGDEKLGAVLSQPVEGIELSSRASNCLKVAHISTVGELVARREEELLSMKNFGKKSLDEIKERLKDMGLSLGMQVG
ncbi:MAG TPA: DNA-directed RNA polymerase subunit alpha [Elusimicrobiota bacterium]|nr:DNA-directed RNA polymerase subunit alpha [Elusimicrobiota bacterium]